MRKFELPPVSRTRPKNIRFPNDVIDRVEAVIRGTEVTFSAFVIEAARVALENLQEDNG